VVPAGEGEEEKGGVEEEMERRLTRRR